MDSLSSCLGDTIASYDDRSNEFRAGKPKGKKRHPPDTPQQRFTTSMEVLRSYFESPISFQGITAEQLREQYPSINSYIIQIITNPRYALYKAGVRTWYETIRKEMKFREYQRLPIDYSATLEKFELGLAECCNELYERIYIHPEVSKPTQSSRVLPQPAAVPVEVFIPDEVSRNIMLISRGPSLITSADIDDPLLSRGSVVIGGGSGIHLQIMAIFIVLVIIGLMFLPLVLRANAEPVLLYPAPLFVV